MPQLQRQSIWAEEHTKNLGRMDELKSHYAYLIDVNCDP